MKSPATPWEYQPCRVSSRIGAGDQAMEQDMGQLLGDRAVAAAGKDSVEIEVVDDHAAAEVVRIDGLPQIEQRQDLLGLVAIGPGDEHDILSRALAGQHLDRKAKLGTIAQRDDLERELVPRAVGQAGEVDRRDDPGHRRSGFGKTSRSSHRQPR